MVDKGRSDSEFVDIANPEAGLITWQGNWRQLEQVRNLSIHWQNYPEAWEQISFLRLLGNTLMYAFVTMIGTLITSSLVAYGFARFRFPGKNILFVILISTIILPPQVTLIPTYAFYVRVLGWGGTWLPLIVPHLFGNAYNVFLLRQYFLTVPREMEEQRGRWCGTPSDLYRLFATGRASADRSRDVPLFLRVDDFSGR